MKKIFSILAVATLLMTGCEKSTTEVQKPSTFDTNEIRIEASIGGTRATLTNFEAGDKMGLYAVEYSGDEVAKLQVSGNYINNEPLTYDGSSWTGNRQLYWSENPCDFYAIYPYMQPETVTNYIFDLPLDQNRAETEDDISGYEAADLMWAKTAKVSQSDNAVPLQFKHMMTRLVVNIERGPSYEGELPEDITVHIYNTLTTAIVDWTIGSLKADTQGARKTITMRQVDGDTFEAIVVPQFIERRTPFIEVTMEGIAYLLESSASLRPGKQHTYTVTLNTSPEQEKIEINIDGEVGEW